MKLADYLVKFLADYGIKHVFMLTGGGAMHLNCAFGSDERIQYICNHHEQATAMSAEAYARVTNSLGVVCVTTGPGGVNTLNGVFGAWTDSIPLLVISGQVKRATCMSFNQVPGMRQYGDQEVDITSMVKGITKYAEIVREPEDIKFHLEKAIHLANNGRKGPVWLDIPVDVQGAEINIDNLKSFSVKEEKSDQALMLAQAKDLIKELKNAKRPSLIIGSGLRLANAENELAELKKYLKIPMVSSWTASDLIAGDPDYYCGVQGSLGNRAGNFTVQNSDLVLMLGARMGIRQVSYNWENFAPKAFKAMVDIDKAELNKPSLPIDLKINFDLKDFLQVLIQEIKNQNLAIERQEWLDWAKERVQKYPSLSQKQIESEKLNPYYFFDQVMDHFDKEDIICTSDGAAAIIPRQIGKIKQGQIFFTNSGSASMGYGLPAAIGAAIAFPEKRVICFEGDGSIQMNLQELQTVIHHNLNVKIFVINNAGYLSMRLTQSRFFESRFVGANPESGVSFPGFIKLAEVYGFQAFKIESKDDLNNIDKALNAPGPVLCEVVVDPDQGFEPKLSSKMLEDGTMVSASLEDMAPFLDPEELKENILD